MPAMPRLAVPRPAQPRPALPAMPRLATPSLAVPSLTCQNRPHKFPMRPSVLLYVEHSILAITLGPPLANPYAEASEVEDVDDLIDAHRVGVVFDLKGS